jgi:Domain of unknown function (DUF4386)
VEQTPEFAWGPGGSLRNLYRIAGASLMVAAVLYVWAFAAEVVLPPPGLSTESLLQYIAEYRSYYVASYVLFTVANSLSVVGAFGIYAVTRVAEKSFAVLGAGLLLVGFIVTLLSSTTPGLLALSAAFSASAGDPVSQQALAIAAEAVAAGNNPFVGSSFIGMGVILVSAAMTRGAFARWLPYLGFFVGALNIVRVLPSLAGYTLVTALFVAVSSVWIFGVGRRVYKEA